MPALSQRALWKHSPEPEYASPSRPNPAGFALARLPLLVTPRLCLSKGSHEDARIWSSFPSTPWQDLAVRGGSCSEQQEGVEICLAAAAAAAQRLLSAAHQTHRSRETLESAPAGPGLRGEGRS